MPERKPVPDMLTELRRRYPGLPPRFLLVDIHRQRISLVEDGHVTHGYPVSTAARGAGNRDGSLQTPLGVHRVAERIGEGAPHGTIFEGRADTGRRWLGETLDRDLILSRILRLEGLEDGVNRGPDIDSLERCIYIHGTNHESRIGTACSHGCVRMRNADVVRLFDQVREGDIVVIDQG